MIKTVEGRAKRLCSLIKEIVDPSGRRWLRAPDAVLAISQEMQAAQREAMEKCLAIAEKCADKPQVSFDYEIAAKIRKLIEANKP